MRATPRAGGHAGRRAVWLLSLAVGLAAAGALRAQPAGVALIVPGEAIGPLRLGMSAAEVRGASGRLPCEIAVAFAEDRAARLETNCGVAYQTAEGLTVGLDGSRIWWVHGEPDLVVPSNLPGTRADWFVYRGEGIGFRVVYAPTGSLIQAIAIFRGSSDPGLRRRPGVPPPVVPPAPPPALGD
ncbi:MAG: hypothetical protein QN159_05385 [Armatimonadota bacterium]|nr:hypothetical protein [Armatimonadota bacterium]